MPQVEPRVLDVLMHAAKDAASHEAIAAVLAVADTGTNTASSQQRDALVTALRLSPSGTGKRQDFAAKVPGGPLTGRLASLSDATALQLEIWSAYAEAVSHPFVRGHLHHLLLAAGDGSRPERIRGAVAGYLDAAPLLLGATERFRGLRGATTCLRRAGDLARTSNQTDLCKRVTDDTVALAEHVLAAPEDEPRIMAGLLEGLRVQRYDVTDLAERAAHRYASDVYTHVDFLKLLQKEAPESRRTKSAPRSSAPSLPQPTRRPGSVATAC